MTASRTRAAAEQKPAEPEPGTPEAIAAEGQPAPVVDGQLVSTPMPADFVQAVADEYGELRAVSMIYVYGAPAFAPGHAVPRSHPMAEQWLADGSVIRVKD